MYLGSDIPSDIIDTRGTTGITEARGTIGVFHPAPFGIVDILDAFDIRDRTTSAWSSPRSADLPDRSAKALFQ